jgi:hypothetical protein
MGLVGQCTVVTSSPRTASFASISAISDRTVQRSQPTATLLAMVAAVFTLGCMAPWMVAAARGKPDHLSVFWLNLLLGWTVIGWIVAVVKAASPHEAVVTRSAV